jgi:hypothetical protein
MNHANQGGSPGIKGRAAQHSLLEFGGSQWAKVAPVAKRLIPELDQQVQVTWLKRTIIKAVNN